MLLQGIGHADDDGIELNGGSTQPSTHLINDRFRIPHDTIRELEKVVSSDFEALRGREHLLYLIKASHSWIGIAARPRRELRECAEDCTILRGQVRNEVCEILKSVMSMNLFLIAILSHPLLKDQQRLEAGFEAVSDQHDADGTVLGVADSLHQVWHCVEVRFGR